MYVYCNKPYFIIFLVYKSSFITLGVAFIRLWDDWRHPQLAWNLEKSNSLVTWRNAKLTANSIDPASQGKRASSKVSVSKNQETPVTFLFTFYQNKYFAFVLWDAFVRPTVSMLA